MARVDVARCQGNTVGGKGLREAGILTRGVSEATVGVCYLFRDLFIFLFLSSSSPLTFLLQLPPIPIYQLKIGGMGGDHVLTRWRNIEL